MSNVECPQAVLDYISDWEDLEPFTSPACITGDGYILKNVWAVWYDEEGTMHAVDYTDGNLREYLYTNAYATSQQTEDYASESTDLVVQELQFNMESPTEQK